MNRVYKKVNKDKSPLILVSALVLASIIISFNVKVEASMDVEVITIIGTKKDMKDLAGSGAVIDNEALERQWTQILQKYFQLFLECI